MAVTDLKPLVGEAFVALADVLQPQPAAAWDEQSLCELWRVRHVVAHVSNAARYATEEYMAEVQADGGDFGATTNRLAERDGALDPQVLLANLRDERLHCWEPPGGGAIGALTHVVIHGLDATTPLGIEQWLPEAQRRTVLDTLAEGGAHARFGTRIDGVRLHAPDLDWQYGSGSTVSAASEDLILLLSGRRLGPDRVRGTLP